MMTQLHGDKIMDEYVEVRIPKRLYDKLLKILRGNDDFKSIDELVTFLLESILADEECEAI